MKHLFSIFCMGLMFVCMFSLSIAQWSANPSANNAISTAANNQASPSIASDGIGGAIITWGDYRGGTNRDIYAQRINSAGVVQWTADGVLISNSTAGGNQGEPIIVSDGAGGAIITWQDYRNGSDNIYAQLINSSGVVRWTANGIAIATGAGGRGTPTIISDGSGGAIISWQDSRSSNYDVYAQRINSAGVVQWTANGVAISNATNDQTAPTIISDGAAGAIITWQDDHNDVGNDNIYAQRINTSGIVQWTANGVAISTASSFQRNPIIIDDGAGGAIITWKDYRKSNFDIFAQRINSTGVVQWTANGVAISTATNGQSAPTIVSDGGGGAIITWQDERNGFGNADIYAQRVNPSGAVQWTANGIAICGASFDQYSPVIVSDGAGGAIITWTDDRGGSSDIYTQRVNASGALQWIANGVATCSATSSQYGPSITRFGVGGAIITWYDNRSGTNYDIYAQNVNPDGTLGSGTPIIGVVSPNGGEDWPLGTSQQITWWANAVTNVKIELSTNNGTSWSTIVASTPAAASSYNWVVSGSVSSHCRIRVSDASNASVNGVSSVEFTILPILSAPGNLVALANGGTYPTSTINLTWADNSNYEDGFRIEAKLGAGGTYFFVDNVGPNVHAYSAIDAFDTNKVYYFRVMAFKGSSLSVPSNEFYALTMADPTYRRAVAVSSSEITVIWSDNALGETGYKVERKTGVGGTYSEIADLPANSTLHHDVSLASGTTYYYRVRAYALSYSQSAYKNFSGYCGEGIATTNFAVSIGSGHQVSPVISGTGQAGATISWVDLLDPNAPNIRTVFVRPSAAGGLVGIHCDGWGFRISTREVGGYILTGISVPDGDGGAIFTWSFNGDIFAQRVNARCELMWYPHDGVPICMAEGDQYLPKIVSDRAGGAIISWQDYRNGNGDIYAQRINATGNELWESDGVAICTASWLQNDIHITSDGYGGATIAWRDIRGATPDIYARRINSAGEVLWSDNGVPICTASGEQSMYDIKTDFVSGAAIITWWDVPHNTFFTNRIDATGSVQWGDCGIALCNGDLVDDLPPTINVDHTGITHYYWMVGFCRLNNEQQITAAGEILFPGCGRHVCGSSALINSASGGMKMQDHQEIPLKVGNIIADSQAHATITSDGTGGVIIAWQDSSMNGTGWNIYAQRIDSAGVVQWGDSGIAVSNAANDQISPVIVGDGTGGAIIAWQDYRNGTDWDIYAQYIDANGILDGPARTLALSIGDGWNLISLPLTVNNYSKSILYPTAVSEAFAYEGSYVIEQTLANGKGYWLKVDGSQAISIAGSLRFLDTVAVTNGWNIIGSISTPVDVANITSEPPGMVVSNFSAYTGSYVDATTIEPGKAYWVKVGGNGSLILSSSASNVPTAAKIKIVATDEMPPPAPDGNVLHPASGIPHKFALEQNYPNPFNPTTTFKYQLPTDSRVTLKIYNVLGQVVSTITDEVQSAGYKSQNWNANSVASGMYFYRLDAFSVSEPSKSFTQVKKMLLLK